MRPQLDRQEIVAAAIKMAGRTGLERVTMRALAEELGVTAMALYHYVPSKTVLLQLVADEIIDRVDLPGADAGDWDVRLTILFRAMRAELGAHRGVGPFLLGSQVLTPGMDRLVRITVAMLVEAGFDRKEAALTFTALHNFLLGRLHVEGAIRGPAKRRLRRRPEDSGVPPEITAPADEHFEFGLAALLAGLRARHGGAPSG